METTPNPLRGTVAVTLADNEQHIIKFDHEAVFTAEDTLRKAYNLTLIGINTQQLGFGGLAVLLWAGLLHESPKLTLSQARKLLPLKGNKEVSDALFTALAYGFGFSSEDLDNAGAEADKAKNAPGPSVA
jgi:hypothetical protein